MPLQCGLVTYRRPCRRKARVYTARDAGRVAAYARRSGASEAELMKYVSVSLGVPRDFWCLLDAIITGASTGVLFGALIAILKGVLSVAKGIKILATGKKSKIVTSILELLIPKKYWEELGGILIWIGAVEIISGSLIALLTLITSDTALQGAIHAACEYELAPDRAVDSQPQSTWGQELYNWMIEYNDAFVALKLLLGRT